MSKVGRARNCSRAYSNAPPFRNSFSETALRQAIQQAFLNVTDYYELVTQLFRFGYVQEFCPDGFSVILFSHIL